MPENISLIRIYLASSNASKNTEILDDVGHFESVELSILLCEVNLETASRMYTIFGVAGTIRLLAGTYVLVITSRKEVGTYLGYPIFRVMSRKFLCCNEGLSNLNNQQYDGFKSSFLQVRGSIPLLWEQIIDLSYKLRLAVIEHQDTVILTLCLTGCIPWW
ncbi:unnamed protein product [Lactuca virosa]|uniref:SAC domain-containing protein n=1 Tax=Lactuca virosa TaxID=75947 RepID=A0AAU9MHY9_9ASTR|nr:unnamed protein product [Lactuca virosa]